MDKNEILEKSRKENKGFDEAHYRYEEISRRAATALGLLVCVVIGALDEFLLHTDVAGRTAWVIYAAMVSAEFLTLGIGTKKKFFIIAGVIAVISMILSFVNLIRFNL